MEIVNTNHIEHISFQEEQEANWYYFEKTFYKDSLWNYLRGKIGKVLHEQCISDESNPLGTYACTSFNTKENESIRGRFFVKNKIVYMQAYVCVTLSSGNSHTKRFSPGATKADIEEFIKVLKTPNLQVEI